MEFRANSSGATRAMALSARSLGSRALTIRSLAARLNRNWRPRQSKHLTNLRLRTPEGESACLTIRSAHP